VTTPVITPFAYLFVLVAVSSLECAGCGGVTGPFWKVFLRNAGIALALAVGYVVWGFDFQHAGDQPWQLLGTVKEALDLATVANEFETETSRLTPTMIWGNLAMQTCFCVASSLVVAGGIWDIKTSTITKMIAVLVYGWLVYPLFGSWNWGGGWLEAMGFRDFAGGLVIWGLAALFVAGIRIPQTMGAFHVPAKKKRSFGHRYLGTRGSATFLLFFVFTTAPVAGLSFALSKAVILGSISVAVSITGVLLYWKAAKPSRARRERAPALLAVLAAFVAVQACDLDAIPTGFVAGSAAICTTLFLRLVPLDPRFWDPCSTIAVFGIGGVVGVLGAGLFEAQVSITTQLLGLGVAALLAGGCGWVVGRIVRGRGSSSRLKR